MEYETRDIAVLLVENYSQLTLGSVVEPLRVANRTARRPLYRWRLYGDVAKEVRSSSGMRMRLDAPASEIGSFDMLFLLASEDPETFATKPLLRLLRQAARQGKAVCAFDSAAYIFALSGVLDGHRATTHWEDLEDFQERSPRIDVVPDRFVTDRLISTTSGSLPSLDFTLDLLRRQHGLALAMSVSSLFIYDFEPPGATINPQYMVAASGLGGRYPKLAEAIRVMEQSIQAPLRISDICGLVGIGERDLQRQFRAALKTSPHRFYRVLRLNAGRRLLENTNRNNLDIAIACGFVSRAGFARAFATHFGVPPCSLRRN